MPDFFTLFWPRPRLQLVASVLATLLLSSVSAQTPAEVSRLMAAAGLPADALAFVALRVDNGEVVASRTPARPMQPASTMKLLTAAVALDRLGPAWRSRSDILRSAWRCKTLRARRTTGRWRGGWMGWRR